MTRLDRPLIRTFAATAAVCVVSATALLAGCEAFTALNGDRAAITFSEINAASGTTCAATSLSSTYCWGNGGGTPSRFAPALVLHGFTGGAFHQCALDADSAAWCWGSNHHGQLGIGATAVGGTGEFFTVPKLVQTTRKFRQISANGLSTCGIATDSATYCWGDNDPTHPLGITDTGERFDSAGVAYPYVGVPTVVPAPTAGTPPVAVTFALVSVGANQRCATTAANDVYCWGQSATVKTPTLIAGGAKLKSVVGATTHTCGLDASGRAFCWGTNDQGQLGTGDTLNKANPTATTTTQRFTAITVGVKHTCGITSAGAAFCWGLNVDGRLGDTSTTRRTAAVAVAGGFAFSGITAGTDYTCGVTSDGAAMCWGSNATGQLGNGSKANSLLPTAVRVP